MKATKLFFGDKRLKDVYVGAKWYQVYIYKITRFIRKAVRLFAQVTVILFVVSIVAGSGYGFGKYTTQPIVTEGAVKEVVRIEVQKLKFEEIPMLVKICNAESGGKQFEKNGNVLRGRVDKSDLGFCQINERYNNDEARRLGYDIYTEQGNKDFAIYLYLTRGTSPWEASRGTWSK
jgi:hypothetical protein